VLGRAGFAMAGYLERRLSGAPGQNTEAEGRLRAVEEECAVLRQELNELHDAYADQSVLRRASYM